LIQTLKDEGCEGSGPYNRIRTMEPIIPRPSRLPSASARYGGALVACAVATAVILVLPRALWLTSGALVYLLAVLAVAALWDRGPAILASVVSFVALDFMFIEPRFTLSISSADEWVALVAYLVVAVVTSQLAAGQRERYLDAEAREREARLLHDLTDLLGATPFSTALSGACDRLRAELDAEAVVIVVDVDEVRTRAAAGHPGAIDATAALTGPQTVLGEGRTATAERSGRAGRWLRVAPAYRPAGAMPRLQLARVAIRRGNDELGSIRIGWSMQRRAGAREARLLDTVAGQLAAAIERERLRAQATETEALRRASELKSVLLDAVSHDLRTPLSAILASADSLLQEDVAWSADDRGDFLVTIEQEATRLNRIVGNLLDLGRIQGGVLVPARQWHDPALVVREALHRLADAASEHDVVLDAPAEMAPIFIDPVELDQVIANLVENAIKYTPPAGMIIISVTRADDELRITIEDSGPGIPRTALPHVFEPFYRAPGPHAGSGSGLGLAVAEGLIRAHGGRIWAENGARGGAAFTIALPAPAIEGPAELIE